MTHERGMVVAVHGLGGSRLDMWPITRRLKRLGFRTHNWGYVSVGTRIESVASRLADDLAEIDRLSPSQPFHVVTHSMGGIIFRAVLEKERFENLGRVVMLAPPHRGSHVARKFSPMVGWIAPSLRQLSDHPDSFVNQLSNSLSGQDVEFGIVRATKDRVIAPDAVYLPGCSDLANVQGHHGILTWYAHTGELVENFLLRGQFDAAKSPKVDRARQVAEAL